MRDTAWQDRVKLERVSDHFIFSVESTGALPARILVQEEVKILVEKCKSVLSALGGGPEGGGGAVPTLAAARAAIYSEATMRSAVDDAGDL